MRLLSPVAPSANRSTPSARSRRRTRGRSGTDGRAGGSWTPSAVQQVRARDLHELRALSAAQAPLSAPTRGTSGCNAVQREAVPTGQMSVPPPRGGILVKIGRGELHNLRRVDPATRSLLRRVEGARDVSPRCGTNSKVPVQVPAPASERILVYETLAVHICCVCTVKRRRCAGTNQNW